MSVPLLLIAYAVAVAAVAPLLSKGTWSDRSPRIGILVWQALSVTIIAGIVFAGAALAVPAMPFTSNLADFLRACVMTLQEQYSTPGGAIVTTVGAFTAVAVLMRTGFCIIAELFSAHRARRQQLQSLALLARWDASGQFLILDHDDAAAYCLPGRKNEIVFTSAALGALNADQRAAVLAHEMAHLRGRHHLILATANAIHRAFPRVPAFRIARTELQRLVEMDADDRAARSSSRLTVATAVVRLAEAGSTPAVALGAGGASALARVRRLASPNVPLGALRTLFALTAAAAMFVLPLSVAAAPAVSSAYAQTCPSGFPASA
ncbi:M56 family metallopeptidase [Arthrobacter sp. TB 23]|uniref:M56 family metallopeptidase n=1 Tax=Arthrobacter sp. TB 23 TaxID=494419 RepID=UPI0002D6F95C|nr:M56 family metallopeptidase [Arthrobacter sp. TB 23]